jgi:uncharacterized protein YkwD
MIDLVLGAAIALLIVRGWFRGFVREALDLAGLVAGVILSFRLSPMVGRVLTDMSGMSEGVARFVAGAGIFLLVGIGAAVLARSLERKARLPGLNLINRAWGAGVAGAWGMFVATLLLSLLTIVPMPSAVSSQLDESTVTQRLTDPEGMPQLLFSRLSGDVIVQQLLNLEDAVGDRRAVIDEDEALTFIPAAAEDLDRSDADALDVYERLNRSRIEAGVPPLAWSASLAEVAAGHALEMYTAGFFAHRSPVTGTVTDRLAAAEITYVRAGENLALAATTSEVHDGLMDSPGHRENILRREFSRVGIAVYEGPLGLMVVQVFTG